MADLAAAVGEPVALADPWAPAARTLDPLAVQDHAREAEALADAKRNPAPRVTADTTKTINGIAVTVKTDATGGSGSAAKTVGTPTSSGSIDAETENGKVLSFTNTIAYSLEIQTTYGTGKPDDDSATGGGTTATDKTNGDVTLGFHESCHRADFLAYLTATAPPKFGGKKGQAEADFQKAMDDYDAAWGEYFKKMNDKSNTATDETGDPTRTAWCAAVPGRCP